MYYKFYDPIKTRSTIFLEDAPNNTSFYYKEILYIRRGKHTDWGYICEREIDGVHIYFHPRVQVVIDVGPEN